MPVYCQNCGRELNDPGGDLNQYTCSHCGSNRLVRVPKKSEGGAIVGAGIGAAVGAGIGGPVGAIIGAGLGYFIGKKAVEQE